MRTVSLLASRRLRARLSLGAPPSPPAAAGAMLLSLELVLLQLPRSGRSEMHAAAAGGVWRSSRRLPAPARGGWGGWGSRSGGAHARHRLREWSAGASAGGFECDLHADLADAEARGARRPLCDDLREAWHAWRIS